MHIQTEKGAAYSSDSTLYTLFSERTGNASSKTISKRELRKATGISCLEKNTSIRFSNLFPW